MNPAPIIPGTLDLLVLKAVSLGREHGYGVLLRIQRASLDALLVELLSRGGLRHERTHPADKYCGASLPRFERRLPSV